MLKSCALLLSALFFTQSASADVAPKLNLMSDYRALVCVNPQGDDPNAFPFAMFVRRYRADGLFTYLQFKDGTFGIKDLSISNGNLILSFSAAQVGQMYNDERLQERLVVDAKTASAVRIQDQTKKISQIYPHCKLFASEDQAPMIKWVKSLKNF